MFLKLLIVFIFSVGLFSQELQLEKVTLQLQWKYQFQFAGFIVAKERGYYKDVGLDVEIREYTDQKSIEDLENNKIDYAINNSLLAYHNKKLNNVTLLATYFQRSPLIIVTQPEVKSVLDLKGKRIMMSQNNRYNSSLSILLDYFSINEINANFMDPSFNIEDFVTKKVDAITAFRSNELYELDKRGIKYNVIDPVEHGFSTNAINLFASHEKVAKSPAEIKKFLQATKKGWEYALENMEEVATLIHEKYQPNKSIELLKYEALITKELMLLDLYDIGEVNQDFVLKTFTQLMKQGKIDKDQTSDKLFITNKAHEQKIFLTEEEKEWLKQNSEVLFTGDPNWLPYEAFTTKGEFIGIVAEHLRLLEKNSGLQFVPVQSKSWSDAQNIALNGKVKVISSDEADVKLNRKFRPIEPYTQNPIVIIMDMKNNYVEDLNSLKDKKIVIIKDYGYTADLFARYPDINFIEVENIQEGLYGVSEGKYDVMLSSMALASYTIADMGIHNLKIVGKTPIIMDLTLFISKEEPILYNIVNKAMQSISNEQKYAILNNWIKQHYIEKTDYTYAITIGAFLLAIILVILLWSIKLKREIQKRVTIEKQLRSTTQRMEGLYKLSPVGIVLNDINGKFLDFNESFREICGYSEAELKNLDFWELTPKKYTETEMKHFEILKKTGFYGPYEKEYIRKDGSLIAINLNGMIITNPDGKQYVWSLVEDISQRKAQEKVLQHSANYDLLTDLPNRTLFADRLKQSMLSSERNGKKVIILYMDLDGFKEINDIYGHDVGDQLLIKVAKKMQSVLRSEDSIARLGGDEFVVLLNNFDAVPSSINLINRILQNISRPILLDHFSLNVTVSIGVTYYPQEESVDADQLLRQSDQAMYQAKISGRNRYHIFNPDEDRMIRGKHENLEQIDLAIKNNEFLLYYQPKVNLRTGKVVGLEALVRWRHPQNGILAPGAFLPLIEGSYLDIVLGEWVINSALSQMKQWRKEGFNLPVSINISAAHIQQSDFVERFETILGYYPHTLSENIELELLETTSIENMYHVSQVASELNELGVQISLDDFGTGYSSLTYLKNIPAQTLKIDQSFVRDMLEDPEDLAIIDGIIGLAKSFDRKVLAEGMERIEHGKTLLLLGCELAQGYAISKPIPANEVQNWAKSWIPDPSWANVSEVSSENLSIIYAIAEHRLWIEKVDAIVSGKLGKKEYHMKNRCRFGRWLESFEPTANQEEAYNQIVILHDDVHEEAERLISMEEFDAEEQNKLDKLHQLRDTLVEKLHRFLD